MDFENIQLIHHLEKSGKKTYIVRISHLADTNSTETLCGLSFASTEDRWLYHDPEPADYENTLRQQRKRRTEYSPHQKYLLENVECDECYENLIEMIKEWKKAKYDFPREL